MHLFVDLNKAFSVSKPKADGKARKPAATSGGWREQQHPREVHGKFTAISSGSRVVTNTGKKGTVESSDTTHHTVRFEDGKKGKVARSNALHEKDFKKVEAAKAKTKAKKTATAKGQATKTANKTNATGKTGAAKTVADPTAKAKPAATAKAKPAAKAPAKAPAKASEAKKTAAKAPKAQEEKRRVPKAQEEKRRVPKNERDVIVPKKKLDRDMAAPTLKRNTTHDENSVVKEAKQTIENKPMSDYQRMKEEYRKNEGNTQNTGQAEYTGIEHAMDAPASQRINHMWNTPEVQGILSKPAAKRSADDIKKVAGQITNGNDGLAHFIVHKMAASRGLQLVGRENLLKRHLGAKRSKEGKDEARNDQTVRQATGIYGDLLQSARAHMFQTLHNVLSGSQNPGQSTAISAHVIQRMKQGLHRDIYDFMNDIPAPHEIRGAIGVMKKAESDLTQELGREPSKRELADRLSKNEKFMTAPITKAPHYDKEKDEWVQTNKQHTDPLDRLTALQQFAAQQKTSSTSKDVSDADGREVSLEDGLSERTQASPETQAIEKERQEELKGALPKALKEMELSDDEIHVLSMKHSQASETGTKASLTSPEVAKKLNEKHGSSFTSKNVDNLLASAMKKLERAKEKKHPALQQLALFKSLLANSILKSMYEFDLVKSLASWGVDHSVLEEVHTKDMYADSITDLRKSLQPHEYVGAYLTMDDGSVVGKIVEYALPDNNSLFKSFNAFHSGLKKSMFPHIGGGNHAVNEKAKAYVKANAKKYGSMSAQQHSAAKGKGKALTWSEELLLKHPGSAWITWGGKRILVNGTTGDVLYDSANEAHREEHHGGSQEDKTEYHHEKDALDAHEGEREKATHDEWKAYVADQEKKAAKGSNTVSYDKMREDFAKGRKDASFDDEGNLKFVRDNAINEDNAHLFDHGIQAFRGELEKMKEMWEPIRVGGKDDHEHHYTQHYADMSEDERKAYDSASKAERTAITGKHLLEKEGVTERLQKFHDDYKAAGTEAEKRALAKETLADLQKMSHGSMALANKRIMIGKDFDKGAALTGFLKQVAQHNPSFEGNREDLEQSIGTSEVSRGRDEAHKNHIPKGRYLVGNPRTGKTMVIDIGEAYTGGAGSQQKDEDGNLIPGKFAAVIKEAFDPEGRENVDMGEDGYMSWGSLGKALGYTGGDMNKLKENLASKANTDPTMPMLKPISDEEFAKERAKTKSGLQDSMLHKEFKLVDQQDDGSKTFAQKMPDGTTNHVTTDAEGMIKDPLMQRLLNQRNPVSNEKELNELLKNAVGNRSWVTAHFGSDIHIGDALGHHVQLEYDGKGAPRVVGGKYDGYRYIDSKDVPKGATDPATGEPVKALFKNGKLVDRRFTTTNKVPMKEGNAVLYPDGDKFRKGRIHQMQGDQVKVTDGKGHVIGMFKKSELKNATEEGRILSNSGNAVVKMANEGKHRMKVGEAFDGAKPKAKELFAEALRKAKVNSAFDDDGNLKGDIELSEAMHRNLSKVLGRSKAGKEMLRKFTYNPQKELEVHVPEHLRDAISAEGVKVLNNGTARISAGKFESLRDVLNQNGAGLSLTHDAQEYMADHFGRKDRKPPKMEKLKTDYQPSTVSTDRPEFDKHYKAQFNAGSYLMNPKEGLYSTQLEGIHHFVSRGRALAGHGMGTGKTILGVIAGLHYKADMLAKGEKPKKTLIVAPKGIMSDWGKEISSHTNSKGLFIGGANSFDGAVTKDGKKHWGQEGKEQEVADVRKLKAGAYDDGDHDFHIVNYDTFMKHRDHFANSGLYDNIAIDEVHAFKNQKGERGKSLAETTDKFKNVWGLSGTPMENDAREAYSLIDTITGGRHELGSMKEFTDNYMQKDKNGKLVGIKADKAEKLGDIMANVIQFRGGEDVKYNDGSKIPFPDLAGDQPKDGDERPRQSDFIGNMVDRNRDHNTNTYYGTKHSVTDFDTEDKEVTNSKNGEKYTVTTTKPKNMTPEQTAMYAKYKELEEKYLPESKRNELATAAATGMDSGKKDGGNYLTAMQKLQKFLNAPLSHKIYVGAGNALDSDETGVQSEKGGKGGLKEGEHYNVDKNGFKRYFESDGNGGYLKDANGNPRELPPLHHQNPKAQYLQDRIHGYLDGLRKENAERVKQGKTPMVPKIVVKSSYTTFGTDIIDNVLSEVRNSHPIFKDLHDQGFKDLGQGRFTGDADDREGTKVGFRGDKNNYEKNQGKLWATTVSPAGKEGVDFGNAHAMFHFDQDWNPQKMAQFTARVRRSDSWKTHKAMGRANQVRVESLHMPNTVEDFMFNAQDSKIKGVEQLTSSTKQAEKVPKMGDTQGTIGHGHRGFTSTKKPRQPKETTKQGKKPVQASGAGGGTLRKLPAASADKALKLVVLL